ncbi:MFS transporter, OPA family, solute carrier family 37 (glycerol-3-phosphate transporter), member 1/2 [Mytilus galloprovincialis]|uniref:Sugar phosphate exchanger 3 n=1 Tax=Mytilus galloprovincialis TaxID=29158 RepID=A0A8B6GJV7_MYTGA|nr:MFS transporter, OPA family, solute carrier family 37 (glycerol-3-phosphate transporter), member 1/2 [Mytilus galloprovincialis]
MVNRKPPGIYVLPSLSRESRNVAYRAWILILTFLVYTCYHMSKKPVSVVKNVLYRNCSVPIKEGYELEIAPDNTSTTFCDWAPFDQPNHKQLLGSLDLAFLFSYAFGMFFSGHIAERLNLRYFLSGGMMLVGIFTAAFGMGYFFNIHSIYFYVGIQVVSGLVQSSGWPSVVTCVGNWYGKGKRGLIMGIWNSHTSVGNILGSLIAGAFVTTSWGWSFAVPGLITFGIGVIVFFFLVPDPEDVGCDMPDQHGTHVVAEHGTNKTLNIDPTEPSETSPLHRYDVEQSYSSIDASTQALIKHKQEKPITIWGAFFIPGVAEFSLCLFCAKLVSYTFLFWLPNYIEHTAHYDAEKSADVSTLFDVGGIVGGIAAGLISDNFGGRATTCAVMLILAAPVMYIYNLYGSLSLAHSIGLSFACGTLVNGPYALITTAVSADLGTHKVLEGNTKALATVTAVIDGTGSIGAAIGPLLAGLIPVWNDVFIMLIISDILALLCLIRLVYKELRLDRLLGCTGD